MYSRVSRERDTYRAELECGGVTAGRIFHPLKKYKSNCFSNFPFTALTAAHPLILCISFFIAAHTKNQQKRREKEVKEKSCGKSFYSYQFNRERATTREAGERREKDEKLLAHTTTEHLNGKLIHIQMCSRSSSFLSRVTLHSTAFQPASVCSRVNQVESRWRLCCCCNT